MTWSGYLQCVPHHDLPHPGKVQIAGHVRVRKPEANSVRIVLDTSGGFGKLTACLLRSGDAEPIFVSRRV